MPICPDPQSYQFNQCRGRFYKNPLQAKEIWCSIGFGFKNKQIYPKLEPWTEEFVTEEQFSQFIQFLEKEFIESPTDLSLNHQNCAIFCCALTLGVCFCDWLYWVYKRHKLESFRCRTIEAFNDQARDMGLSNVRLHFAARFLPEAGGYWIDSKNHPLEHGPPIGFSIVFTLAEEMVWPPGFFIPQRQIISSEPPPYGLNEFSVSNLYAEYEQNNFCTNCGKKFTAEHRFCEKCGSSLQ